MLLTHLVLMRFFPGAAKGASPPPATTRRHPGYDERRARILREDREFLDMLAGALPLLDDA